MESNHEDTYKLDEFRRRCSDLPSEIEAVFNACPKYLHHDISEDQVLHIATKAAKLGYEMAKTDIKLEIADTAIDLGKKILTTIGMLLIGFLYWVKDKSYF